MEKPEHQISYNLSEFIDHCIENLPKEVAKKQIIEYINGLNSIKEKQYNLLKLKLDKQRLTSMSNVMDWEKIQLN